MRSPVGLVEIISVISIIICGAATVEQACAHETADHVVSHVEVRQVPASLVVHGELMSPPAGVSDIKFGELFKMPVGPRGLEPTEKLLSLNGKRVRLVGYMAHQEVPTERLFVLAPLPVSLGDEDESLSDDLPPSAVFVHIETTAHRNIPYMSGLIRLSGTLSVGAQQEVDGHISAVRLQLDPKLANEILSVHMDKHARK